MRTFVLFARKARTDGSFNIEDMPSSGGRMDLVARCVSSALWLSHGMRDDSRIYCVLNGPPNPPVTVLFEAAKLRKVNPDERSLGIWIQKVLSEEITGEWNEIKPGMSVSRKSFQDVIRELAELPIYVLHEKGERVEKFEEDAVFVLGDHVGLPENDESFALRYGKKISLGSTSYLASSCISVIHWLSDR